MKMKKIMTIVLASLVLTTTTQVKADNSIDKSIDKTIEVSKKLSSDIKTSKYLSKIKKYIHKKTETSTPKTTETSTTDDNLTIKQVLNNYEPLGQSIINPSEMPEEGKTEYGALDNLNRATYAKGTITYKLYKSKTTSKRETPVGYVVKNEKVQIKLDNGRTYNSKWFYNRSHLLADSLGGIETRVNMVTGTRQQNVGSNDGKGGMAYLETKVREYLKNNHNGIVYYQAVPQYSENELLPRTVIVSALSKDGQINETVRVYNTATGYTINYLTGDYNKN